MPLEAQVVSDIIRDVRETGALPSTLSKQTFSESFTKYIQPQDIMSVKRMIVDGFPYGVRLQLASGI